MSAIISFIKRSLLPPLFFLLLLLFLVVYSQSPLNHNNFTNSFSYLISSYDKLKTTFVTTTTTTEDHNNNVKNESLLGAPARSPAPLPPPAPLPEPRHADVAVKVRHQKKKKRRVEKIEDDLAKARAAIRKAIRTRNYTAEKEQIYIPRGSVYRNPFAFHQSHIEMEKRFKVWLYKEGEWPLVHSGPVNDIYGIEGQFIQEMESGTSHFMARNPNEAHAFFLPISVAYIIKIIYRPLVTYSRDQLQRLVLDYIRVVADKYPYWNRSSGADHFLVSCHDWAPDISGVNPDFFKNFIRALCNANTSEGFRPHRDVSIPEINIPRGTLGPPDRLIRASTKRPILAFFAGGAHGNIRKILLQHWKDKDKDVQVHEYLASQKSYFKTMGQTRFCLCPSGYEVASPRVVTSLHAGCVPVIISDYYELPFNDVLDWSKFSIHIPSEKIPDIKKILEGIPHDKYVKMQRRVKKVSKHFELNRPAQPFDVIHMLLHSIWLRRLNFMLDTP